MAFLSGKLGKVRINGSTVRVTRWSVTPRADKLDFSNSESAGVGEYLGGIKDLDFTIEFDYYTTDALFVGTVPGALVANIYLYVNDTTGPYWLIPYGIIERMECSSQVRGKVSGSLSGTASGGWTAPAS